MAFNLLLQLLAVGVLILRRLRLGKATLELGAGTFLLLLTFFILNDWRIRPHSLSWIYLGLVMLAFETYERGDQRALLFLPIIFLFWVNCHALFSLGLATLLIWASANLVFTLLRQGSRELRRKIKELGLPLGLSWAACFINPYGLAGLAFPFRQSQILSGDHYASGVVGIAGTFGQRLIVDVVGGVTESGGIAFFVLVGASGEDGK